MMQGRRPPGGGQARHADDWLMTYADTITLLLCLFAVLLALHGVQQQGATHTVAPASAAAPVASNLPQTAIVVAPFAAVAGMPRVTEDADDDPGEQPTQPDGAPGRPGLLTTLGPSADPDSYVASETLSHGNSTNLADPGPRGAFPGTWVQPLPNVVVDPQPIAVAQPASDAASATPTAPANLASPVASTPPIEGAGQVAEPSPGAAKPSNAEATAASAQQGDRITIFQFSSAAFFASGSATLSDSGQSILGGLLERLQSSEFAAYRITVEGHTDDEPISSAQFPSNWELSAARAAAVVRFFVGHRISAQRLRAAGYADTHPLAPNRDAAGDPIAENQAKNRRVVIELEKVDHEGD